jgi:hypothetical protein
MSEPTQSDRNVNGEIHLIATAVTRIETKLDMVIGKTDDHEARIRDLERACQNMSSHGKSIEAIKGAAKETSNRVTRLEKATWFAGGVAAALGGGAGALAGKLVS